MSGPSETFDGGVLKRPLEQLLSDYVMKHSTRVISACQHVADINQVPSIVIPNPYNTTVFRQTTAWNDLREPAMLFAGRYIADKGIFDVLESLTGSRSLGHQPKVRFAGSGPAEKSLREAISAADLGNQVEFLGDWNRMNWRGR